MDTKLDMALPETLTLNVGSPAADIVFTQSADKTGGAVKYFAPSDQSDLAGRPSIQVRHETTKSGLIRSNIKFQKPQYNATDSEYEGHTQCDVTLVRKAVTTVEEAELILEMAEKALAQLRDEISEMDY